jgi:hypothetical protein
MHGLYLLWWVQERHVPAAIVATLMAAGDFVLFLAEVPTGWFADRFGHRVSLIAGSALQVLGILCCWLGQGVPGVLAACVLIALGDGFRSGADQALLYRSCYASGALGAFQRQQARARAFQLAALVVLVLAGGAIVHVWGFAAGWAAETVLSCAGLAVAWAMIEPPPAPEPVEERHHSDATLPDEARADAPPRRVRKDPAKGIDREARPGAHPFGSSAAAARAIEVVTAIAPAAFVGALASATGFLAQTSGRIPPTQMTALVAGLSLAEAVGSAIAIRLPAVSVRAQAILGAAGALLVGLAVAAPATSLFVVVALAALEGLTHPLRDASIQRIAADTARARMASLGSACDMAIKMIALPLAALWKV